MGNIVFTAKRITDNSPAATWVAEGGDATLGASGLVKQKGDAGVDLLIGQPPAKEKQEAQIAVETVRINTGLDKGCDYKNSGALRDGMLFDKQYELEVTKFKNNVAPPSDQDIQWAYRYETEDGVQEGVFLGRGRKVMLGFGTNLNICGRGLTIYAFIRDRKTEGVLNTWVHYRFRWFSREQVKKEVQERKTHPWKIDQNNTSLCGMACIMYLLAKKDPDGYEKMALQLHQQGQVTYKDYAIKPWKGLLEMNPADAACKYPSSSMPYADWITLASLRSSESWVGYKGQAGDDSRAINWPVIMITLGKKLLGYQDVSIDYYKLNKSYIRDWLGSNEKLRILKEDIDADYNNGYQISMMIDSDMMKGSDAYSWSDFSEYHWIVYEGGLQLLNAAGGAESDYDKVTKVKFKEFTWGEDVQTSRTSGGISKSAFQTNYYAYVKMK
ncbi:hypothetical protein [Taibaiella koreensis]|uniref:hypothetical protein n=1 Tax=Taibaiella koreensis TaxID=1268548 RepID=UPI000E5A0C5C|nr:hypothetical protein [Taibaiella koreensis]